MEVTRVTTVTEDYWLDENGQKTGYYSSVFFSNGRPAVQCFYRSGVLHGEYRGWHESMKEGENPLKHRLYVNGELVELLYDMTEEDRFLYALTYNMSNWIED